jgi:O-antigen/teichoic acid export membrane protein
MTRLSRNIAALFSADMARRALGFVAVVYLARVLGKDGFGFINVAFAVLAYGAVLSAAGFPMLGTKRIAQGDDQQFIGEILGARIMTTAGVAVVIILSSFVFLRNISQSLVIALFSLALFAQTFFLDWYFQGKERMNIVSIGRVLSSCIYTFIVLLFVHSAGDLWKVACAAIVGDTMTAIYYIQRFKHENRQQRIHIIFSFQMFQESFLLSIGVIISTFVINFPPLVLSALQSNAEVGVFSAASKIVFFLLVGDRLLLPLLLPASARKQTDSPEALSRLLSEALRWVLLLSLPIAVGGMVLSEHIIVLVFGTSYATAAGIFRVFVWFFFFTMLHSVYVSGLIAAGHENVYGKTMVMTAALYASTVTIGTMWFGAIGAAFGVVISEAMSVLLMRHALLPVITLEAPRAVLRIVFATIIMGCCVLFFSTWNLIAVILFGIVVYSIVLFATRGLTWSEAKTFFARFA